MKTTNPQLDVDLASLRADYCEIIVDNMDRKTMEQYVIESLENDFHSYSLNELKEEIENQYGEDTLNDLINNNSYSTK